MDIDIDINIDIADILGQKYRYPIDIGKGDIDPHLLYMLYVILGILGRF